MFKPLRLFLVLSLAIVSLSFSGIGASASVTFPNKPNTNAFFDSGWLEENNGSSHTLTVAHGMSKTPRYVEIVFSPDQETAYPINWSWSVPNSGNPVTISVDDTSVKMAIWSGAPLHGVWDSEKKWTTYTEGYFRIFAKK
ncbi:MAG: hypothetical protein AAGA60_14300 [Cyanobacteria bacterium P01_E01_bin.42]